MLRVKGNMQEACIGTGLGRFPQSLAQDFSPAHANTLCRVPGLITGNRTSDPRYARAGTMSRTLFHTLRPPDLTRYTERRYDSSVLLGKDR